MSTPSEKIASHLAEAVATLELLTREFELEKEALEAEKDEEIEALKRQLEAERAKLRATRLAFQACAGASNDSEDGRHMMIAAIDLNITWSDTPNYWRWTAVPESRHAVAELLQVCWLNITGRLDASKLTPPNVTYAAYLVYKFTIESLWLDLPPGEAYAGPVGAENSVSKIYLIPEEKQQAGSERADQYATRRADGWMEVKLGEFVVNGGQEGADGGEVEMGFREVSGCWKQGLIVRGMEVRPRDDK
uniref:Uncharacterized protein n=1 Tax=Kalanchoe fedtschenkoi TaxID=63787 RepID=A0A7N0V7L1_KALFE